jgi:general secretion pathway protein J
MTLIRQKSTGFTLIEILLAMFIFTIVVATLFGSYRGVFSTTEAIEAGMENFEMVSNCFNRITLDLQSAYIALAPAYKPPEFDTPSDPYRIVGDTSVTGNGNFSRMRFASTAHVSFNRNTEEKGIAEIVYYVQETEHAGNVLRRSDRLPPYPQFEERPGDPVLCEHVKSLVIIYIDPEGREQESWDSESRQLKYATPRAIKIKLEIGNDSGSIFFETMIECLIYRDQIG